MSKLITLDNYKELLKLEDVFIITKAGKVEEITDDVKVMIETITNGKEILQQKNYYLFNFHEFATTFIKPTSKYKTFNQKYVVYKNKILHEK